MSEPTNAELVESLRRWAPGPPKPQEFAIVGLTTLRLFCDRLEAAEAENVKLRDAVRGLLTACLLPRDVSGMRVVQEARDLLNAY